MGSAWRDDVHGACQARAEVRRRHPLARPSYAPNRRAAATLVERRSVRMWIISIACEDTTEGDRRIAIDSSPLEGAGRVEHTVNRVGARRTEDRRLRGRPAVVAAR